MTGDTDTTTEVDRRSRIIGCFLGGAIGDALGEPIEFMSLSQIRKIIGPRGVEGYWDRAARPGSFTDDTQMTLFTAEGLIRSQQQLEETGQSNIQETVWFAYLRWLDTQNETPAQPGPEHSERGYLVDVPELRKRMAPGNTCLGALRSGQMGAPDVLLNNSKGCGGVMRVAPAGFCGRDSYELGLQLAAITHTHPSGYIAAGALAEIITDVYEGRDLRTSVEAMVDFLRDQPDAEEVRRTLRWALDLPGDRPTAERVESLGGGWVAEEALAISVYCALAGKEFREAVLLAVNHSGDSDSTGSITGQIVGTMLGVGGIPDEWLDGLSDGWIVERVANVFADRYLDGKTLDYDEYPPN